MRKIVLVALVLAMVLAAFLVVVNFNIFNAGTGLVTFIGVTSSAEDIEKAHFNEINPVVVETNPIELPDPGELGVHLSPAIVNVSIGETFTINVLNTGKYEGLFAVFVADGDGREFDGIEIISEVPLEYFSMVPHSKKGIEMLVSPLLDLENLPEKILFCGKRFIGKAESGTSIAIQACARIKIKQ